MVTTELSCLSGAGAFPVYASKQAFSMTKGNLKDNYWILFQTNEDSKQATLQEEPLSSTVFSRKTRFVLLAPSHST